MQHLPWLTVAGFFLAGCGGVMPARDARTAETRAIARDFMQLQYDQKDLKAAKAKYYTADFIQHNPEIASGAHGDQTFIDARQARDPTHYLPVDQWVNKIDHVLVDDKLFAIHHRLYTSPLDRGRVFMDIWRVENGKMVEHWDIIQAISEAPKNTNTMWTDLAPSSVPAPGDPAPESVIRDYLYIGLAENDPAAAADKYLADDFHQHSAHIADGKAALIAYFKARAMTAGDVTRASYVSHILCDADLVLVTRHAVSGADPRGFMYADLFRVHKGKIIEHWDLMQAVPEENVNGNSMW